MKLLPIPRHIRHTRWIRKSRRALSPIHRHVTLYPTRVEAILLAILGRLFQLSRPPRLPPKQSDSGNLSASRSNGDVQTLVDLPPFHFNVAGFDFTKYSNMVNSYADIVSSYFLLCLSVRVPSFAASCGIHITFLELCEYNILRAMLSFG